MKFAIINDTHLGPPEAGYFKGIQRKLVNESERLIRQFVKDMNEREKPAFVVNLGDSIEDVNDREIDIKYFKTVVKLLSGLKMPLYYMVGNHDVRTLSEQDIAELVGHEKMYYSFDKDGYHFVMLSFEMTGDHTRQLHDISAIIPKEQVEWLAGDLSRTDLPTVVLVHYGLADDDMKGNFWFEHQAPKAMLGNRQEVRTILESSNKVIGIINAHQHWNRMFAHNDIPYFTVTSMVENFNNDGVPTGAYTLVELTDKKIEIDVRGNDPAKFEYIASN